LEVKILNALNNGGGGSGGTSNLIINNGGNPPGTPGINGQVAFDLTRGKEWVYSTALVQWVPLIA